MLHSSWTYVLLCVCSINYLYLPVLYWSLLIPDVSIRVEACRESSCLLQLLYLYVCIRIFGHMYVAVLEWYPAVFSTDPGHTSGGDTIQGSTFSQKCSAPVVSEKYCWVCYVTVSLVVVFVFVVVIVFVCVHLYMHACMWVYAYIDLYLCVIFCNWNHLNSIPQSELTGLCIKGGYAAVKVVICVNGAYFYIYSL